RFLTRHLDKRDPRHILSCPGSATIIATRRFPMAQRELLKVLKNQLDFFDGGGYGCIYRGPWRPTLLVRDSPACLNATSTTARPCRECVLFPLIPEKKRNSLIPCHQIPMNAAGETI